MYGGSSRNGSTSGLSGYVSVDGTSTISYSVPPDYPPAEPPPTSPCTVDAGDDLLTFLTEGIDGVDVTMDASVVDGDTTENRWAVVSPAGVTNFPKFSVEDPLNVGADVNVTVTFYEAGVYTLTLTADDGEAYPGSDSLVVTVYANSCAADKVLTPYSELTALEKGDTNYDCKVDLIDFAAMASNWLIDVSLSL